MRNIEAKEIEHTLQKEFRKPIWNKFTAALKEYEMIEENDKIAVCISGGKDSMMLAKCMQILQRYSKIPFTAEYVIMDPGYDAINRAQIIKNAEKMGIPIKVFESDIFDFVYGIEKNPCYMCAKMRRGHLYRYAEELGCNKIALGHHFDDMIETVMISMLYGSEIKTMMPKLKSTEHRGLELIRPLYFINEKDIIAWGKHNALEFIACACKFTADTCHDESTSKRQFVKNLIAELKKDNNQVDKNIFHSVHNVNLDTVIRYKKDGKEYSFLDEY